MENDYTGRREIRAAKAKGCLLLVAIIGLLCCMVRMGWLCCTM